MKKTFFALAALLLVPATAEAQEAHGLGSQTQMILSADRLVPVFSFASTTLSVTQNNVTTEVTESGSSTSLLWGANGWTNDDGDNFSLNRLSPHVVPRVGFDFVVIPHLTIGGSVAFAFSLGGSRETTVTRNNQTVNVEQDAPSHTIIGLAPRVGYIIPFGDVLAFWPRGGFAFYSLRSTTEDINDNNRDRNTLKASVFSLDLDPQFVIAPMEHFFFNVGPLINIPLTGTVSSERVRGNVTTTVDNDLTVWHFGITAGLGGWFNL